MRIILLTTLFVMLTAACRPAAEDAAARTASPAPPAFASATEAPAARFTPTAAAAVPPNAAQTPSPTPTAHPQPTPASASAALRLALPIDPGLLGEVVSLRASSDGSLWVLADHGYGVLREGHWSSQAAGHDQILVGVDDAGRMWLLDEKAGDQINFRDEGAEAALADAGWMPVPDAPALQGRGVLTDAEGRVWLATEQDVRVYDGKQWTIFTLQDLDMLPPEDPDYYTLYTLNIMAIYRQVWVGRCDWGGPGPAGGGVRWWDGQAWQGADAPVGFGCVSAIREGSQGRVWIGVDADLWRYDPAADDWERFAPPPAPEGYRFGYISDIALDPAGDPWPLYALCGGASCAVADTRYRLHAGAWGQIGQPSAAPQILVFDGAGTPWLFTDGKVFRVEGDQPAESPVAQLDAVAAAVDAAGQVWAAGTAPLEGQGGRADAGTGVWALEAAATPAETLAVCPPPGSGLQPDISSAAAGDTIAEKFEPQILDYLNSGGNADGLAAQLERLTLDVGGGAVWQAASSQLSSDVTGDAVDEVILGLLFFEPGGYLNGEIFVFRCQAGGYVGGSIASIGGMVFDSGPDAVLLDALDMNGNGKAEIVFTYIPVIGTHANFTRELRIVEWDGNQFVDLIRSAGNNPHAAEALNSASPRDIMIGDIDGDGPLEVELAHGAGRGPEVSALERTPVDVWAWDGTAFTLAYRYYPSPPVFRIQALWDGDSAARRGEYEAALAFYQQAIFDSELLGWAPGRLPSDAAYESGATPVPEPGEWPRLAAYGRYRILLLHAVRGYLPEAQTVYDTLQQRFPPGSAGGEYAELAVTFWQAFGAGTGMAGACGAAIDYAAARSDVILAPLGREFYGFGQPEYAPEDICPFR